MAVSRGLAGPRLLLGCRLCVALPVPETQISRMLLHKAFGRTGFQLSRGVLVSATSGRRDSSREWVREASRQRGTRAVRLRWTAVGGEGLAAPGQIRLAHVASSFSPW
jgi:hypothetical protein